MARAIPRHARHDLLVRLSVNVRQRIFKRATSSPCGGRHLSVVAPLLVRLPINVRHKIIPCRRAHRQDRRCYRVPDNGKDHENTKGRKHEKVRRRRASRFVCLGSSFVSSFFRHFVIDIGSRDPASVDQCRAPHGDKVARLKIHCLT